MEFNEHKKHKFQYGNPYADYEYVNKNSRKTGPGLILAFLFGIGILALAWLRWTQLSAAEESGGTISLTTIEWALYKVSGKWGITVLFVAAGLFFLIAGVRNFLRLEKLRKS